MNANRLVRGESGIKTEREMANESADAAAELDTKDMDKATTTTVTSQLNSPNANTSNQTTKTTTIEETTIKSLPAAAKALEETKKQPK
ncbi:hypothetical protein DOY81_009622 [Sarcophaga bullata]|nr:hypothetical protein DOY81_009622 [Sarcophaga bullata]